MITALASPPSGPLAVPSAAIKQEKTMEAEQNGQPAPAATQPETAEPVQSGLIAFAEPAGPEALVAEVSAEAPLPAPEPKPEPEKAPEPAPLNAAAAAEVRHAASTEQAKKEFMERVLRAREPEAKPQQAQPVAPRIQEQTRLEQLAGQKMNAHHAAFRANAPQPKREDNGSMTPVFRPNDYVPDPRKAQGNVGARNL
jgi:hypothetical protein